MWGVGPHVGSTRDLAEGAAGNAGNIGGGIEKRFEALLYLRLHAVSLRAIEGFGSIDNSRPRTENRFHFFLSKILHRFFSFLSHTLIVQSSDCGSDENLAGKLKIRLI